MTDGVRRERQVKAPAKDLYSFLGRLQPYAVRAPCGCIILRLMSDGTARYNAARQGIAFAPDMILKSPYGAPCPDCDTEEMRAAVLDRWRRDCAPGEALALPAMIRDTSEQRRDER